MAAEKRGLDAILSSVLEEKQKHGVDTDSLLALLSLVNLMGLVEMIGGEVKESKPQNKGGPGDGPPLPMGMFGRPPSKEQE